MTAGRAAGRLARTAGGCSGPSTDLLTRDRSQHAPAGAPALLEDDIFNGPEANFGPDRHQGANSSFPAVVKGGRWARLTDPLNF